MTNQDRPDPLSSAGCLAYLDSDIASGVTAADGGSQRADATAELARMAGASTGGPGAGERGPSPRRDG